MSRLYLICALLLAGSLRAFSANAEKDDIANVIPTSATKVNDDFAQWCRVEGHTFYLEKVTLADVIKTLKKGEVKNTNSDDPGNADPLWAVVYRDGDHVVLFLADGDMGGPEHTLTGIEIKPIHEYPSAVHLPVLHSPVSFEFGTVGMPLLDLERRLGQGVVHLGSLTYHYEGQESAKTTPSLRQSITEGKNSGVNRFDVTAYLWVHIQEGKIESLGMSHITTF